MGRGWNRPNGPFQPLLSVYIGAPARREFNQGVCASHLRCKLSGSTRFAVSRYSGCAVTGEETRAYAADRTKPDSTRL